MAEPRRSTTCRGSEGGRLGRLLALSRSLAPSSSSSKSPSGGGGGDGGEGLSLRRMVPVHEALMDAMDAGAACPRCGSPRLPPAATGSAGAVVGGDGEEEDGDDDVASLVRSLVAYDDDGGGDGEEEARLCRSALTVGSRSEALAAAQYLLRRSAEGSSRSSEAAAAAAVLRGLEGAALPLLFASPSSPSPSPSPSPPESPPPALWDPEVRDAVVEATFSCSSSRSSSSLCPASSAQTAGRCAALCVERVRSALSPSPPSSARLGLLRRKVSPRLVVDASARVLVRLFGLLSCARGERGGGGEGGGAEVAEAREAVLDAMHRLVLLVIESVCCRTDGYDAQATTTACGGVSASGDVELMRPVTALLLPRLYDAPVEETSSEGRRRRAEELWSVIAGLMMRPPEASSLEEGEGLDGKKRRRRCRDWDDVAPTVAAAVLCVVVPSLASYPLPLPEYAAAADAPQPRCVDLLRHPALWSFLRTSLGRLGRPFPGNDGGGSGGAMMRGGTSFARTGAAGDGRGGGGGGGAVAPIAGGDDGGAARAAAAVDQILRRRCVHVLGKLVEVAESSRSSLSDGVAMWKKYVLCFEALEMEVEAHLVDQIWPTVRELCAAAAAAVATAEASPSRWGGVAPLSSSELPTMTWDWIGSLLSRVLLSDAPTLRKLALYRFFNGDAGISSSALTPSSSPTDTDGGDTSATAKKGKTSKKTSASEAARRRPPELAPLSIVSPAFVLTIVLPSFDSLGPAVGTGIQLSDVSGKLTSDNVTPKLAEFVADYVTSLGGCPERLGELVRGLLGEACMGGLRPRTLALVYGAVIRALLRSDSADGAPLELPISYDTLDVAARCLRNLFAAGSVVLKVRGLITRSFAIMLSRSCSDEERPPDPLLVLRVLELYPTPLLRDGEEDANSDDGAEGTSDVASPSKRAPETRDALRRWLASVGTPNRPENAWASDAGAACASAFVMGHLLTEDAAAGGAAIASGSKTERDIGASIARLCALAGDSEGDGEGRSASGMIWPAINRGLSSTPPPSKEEDALCMTSSAITSASDGKVTRALLLLEYGSKERILTGVGHGELVVDSKTGAMLPPSLDVERLLGSAVQALLLRIRDVAVCSADRDVQADGGSSTAQEPTRSRVTGALSSSFAALVEHLRTMRLAFPSSVVLAQTAGRLLGTCLGELSKLQQGGEEDASADTDACASREMDKVKWIALTYAVLSCGAELGADNSSQGNKLAIRDAMETCETLLDVQFVVPINCGGFTPRQLKAARSLFQFAKWGSLSCLLPMVGTAGESEGETSSADPASLAAFQEKVFDAAADAVHATPGDALLPLFDAAMSAARSALSASSDSAFSTASYPQRTEMIIASLFTVMSDTSHSPTRMFMINAICSLLFRPRLLLEEYYRISVAKERGEDIEPLAPIKDAFGKLMKTAGTRKPHIARSAVSRMAVAWLGCDGVHDDDRSGEGRRHSTAGLSAIPYRDDIINLLIYKETRMDDASAHQEILIRDESIAADKNDVKAARVPAGTSDLSVVRGFILIFLSKLPDPSDELDPKVLEELCHHIILRLLNSICLIKPEQGGSFLLTGSAEYCRKIRAWQALCLLSRFVTSNIAEEVCDCIFEAMAMTLHGQIRYFLEVFSIQCARSHPAVVGRAYVEQIRRRDLSLQHISSLMIIGGNLIVGRYSNDFMRRDAHESEIVPLREVLAGVLPWLSSTQGFSRAIAQLLVHKLIPLVVDMGGRSDSEAPVPGDNDWYLRSMYNFLEANPDMKRLRKKQTKFFHMYDAESVCTADGLLRVQVDDGDEANPLHMAEAIKRCLKEVFLDSHENDAPSWKQAKELLALAQVDATNVGVGSNSSSLVNFQRKILPLDSLNLAMKQSRTESLRNAAGRTRQGLIVCASLIDKVPNLAGLARTAEIFAAELLVIPDLSVCKMDNFKSISVGAEEWIRIKECKEQNLLPWLSRHKQEGYTIVGLEQTSSSSCLSQHIFPDKTVLLLGKEKEGIPVEFLQLVDACVEIPQLGIIRSLNVHVSGALTMWEYTKQMLARTNRHG